MSKLGKVVFMSLILAAAAGGVLPAQAAQPVTEPVKVSLPPRKIFRAILTDDGPSVTNETNDLLVIDRVAGAANANMPVLVLGVLAGSTQIDEIMIPETVISDPDVHRVYAMTQLYVKPGETLALFGTGQSASLSGHYEPMPQP